MKRFNSINLMKRMTNLLHNSSSSQNSRKICLINLSESDLINLLESVKHLSVNPRCYR